MLATEQELKFTGYIWYYSTIVEVSVSFFAMDAIISETRHQIIMNFYQQNSSEGMRFTDKHFKKKRSPQNFQASSLYQGVSG